LLKELFLVSVPVFLPGRSLHVVLRTCGASWVMYHQQVTDEMSLSNAVATKVRDAARKATISDACFPGVSPEVLLFQWSS
jgi:hypothetical protein